MTATIATPINQIELTPGSAIQINGVSLLLNLALAVDIANQSASKLKIYPAMQVPEVWLYCRDAISRPCLIAEEYREVTHSRAFPAISAIQLEPWVQLCKTGTDLTVVRSVRQFYRDLNG